MLFEKRIGNGCKIILSERGSGEKENQTQKLEVHFYHQQRRNKWVFVCQPTPNRFVSSECTLALCKHQILLFFHSDQRAFTLYMMILSINVHSWLQSTTQILPFLHSFSWSIYYFLDCGFLSTWTPNLAFSQHFLNFAFKRMTGGTFTYRQSDSKLVLFYGETNFLFVKLTFDIKSTMDDFQWKLLTKALKHIKVKEYVLLLRHFKWKLHSEKWRIK